MRAQAPIRARALAELRQGRKQSHWMWFLFPQVEGLGASPMARRYAIGSIGEARAYLAHPLLGGNLRTATHAMLQHATSRAADILGTPDDLKFHASMTLFAAIAEPESPFLLALRKYFGGIGHPGTLNWLQINPASGLDGSA